MSGRYDEMKVGDRPGADERFPMSLFEPHEAQAERNHYQSLQTLARRGGLSWCEAVAILEDRDWHKMDNAEQRFRELVTQKGPA